MAAKHGWGRLHFSILDFRMQIHKLKYPDLKNKSHFQFDPSTLLQTVSSSHFRNHMTV
jgi:hypothetical protein